MTEAIFIVIFFLLSLLNLRLVRSVLYPPFIFSALWTVLLTLLLLSGDAFYPLSATSLFLQFLGILSFSAGGVLAMLNAGTAGRQASDRHETSSLVSLFITGGFVILLVALPFYLRFLTGVQNIAGLEDFWVAIRWQTSSNPEGQTSFGIFSYINAFATFLSLAALYEMDKSLKSRLKTVAVISVTLLFHILTVSRLGAMITIFGLVGLALIRPGKAPVKQIAVLALIFIMIFSIPAVLLGRGGSVDYSVAENVTGITESFQVYTLGGLVAFDNFVKDDSIVEIDWMTLRFFALVGNQMGAGIKLDSMVLEATATPSLTNVYTTFLPYYNDYGWPGIAFFSAVAGFITTWVFRSATREDHQFGVLYGLVFAALLLTSANEPFYTSISYWIQAFVFTFIFFKLPDIMTRQRTADISGSMNKPIIGQSG